MIVKNEEHILRWCLASVRRHIKHWVIVDTGSTDNTMGVAMEALKDVPGQYVSHEWNGFGDARSKALELAKGHADYALVIDADETLDAPDGAFDNLTANAYCLWAKPNPNVKFITRRIMRLADDWRYVGVLHEYPTTKAGVPWEDKVFDQVSIYTTQNGARSSDADKYLRDAALLEKALIDEPTNSRYVYYLAQSYRDGGQDEKAAARYMQRTAMGPGLNYEELYCSWLEAARAFGRLGRLEECESALLKARQVDPRRPEAPASLSVFYQTIIKHMPPVGTMNVETCHYQPPVEEAAE